MSSYRVKAGRWIMHDNKCYIHSDNLPDNFDPPIDWIDQMVVIENKRPKKEIKKQIKLKELDNE